MVGRSHPGDRRPGNHHAQSVDYHVRKQIRPLLPTSLEKGLSELDAVEKKAAGQAWGVEPSSPKNHTKNPRLCVSSYCDHNFQVGILDFIHLKRAKAFQI